MVREFGLWASAVGGKIAETSVHTLADLSLPYKLILLNTGTWVVF